MLSGRVQPLAILVALATQHGCLRSGFSENEVFDGPATITASIQPQASQALRVGQGPITFEVAFSRPIVPASFGADDLLEMGDGVVTEWTIVDRGDHRIFEVAASAMSGSGAVAPMVQERRVVEPDGATNQASNVPTPVVFDVDGPRATISRASGQQLLTASQPIVFVVTFDEDITGALDAADLANGVAGTGVTWSITPTAAPRAFAVSAQLSGPGSVQPRLAAGAVSDTLGNPSELAVGETVVFDPTAIPVAIYRASTQASPTPRLPVAFDVVFDRAIAPASFDVSDIEHVGTATNVTWSLINSGDDRTFRLTVIGATGGTLAPRLQAYRVVDSGGSPNLDATLIGDPVVYEPWWNVTWPQRQRITFDNSGQDEDLVDFPVLLTFDPSAYGAGAFASSGANVRFVDALGATQLAHEIEDWTSTLAYVWVKVPRIAAASAASSIWMYFGNASAADAQDAHSVWSNGYAGVWHMNNNPQDGVFDSTANSKDGWTWSMDASNRTNGPVGPAWYFNQWEYARIASSANDVLAPQNDTMTIEAWARPELDQSEPLFSAIVGRQYGTENEDTYFLGTEGGDHANVRWSMNADRGVGTTTAPMPLNQWRYLVGVREAAFAAIYVNGEVVVSTTNVGGPILIDDNDVTFGGQENVYPDSVTDPWLGALDEIRISTVGRSAAWIKAQTLSMTDDFCGFGGVETWP